MSNFQELKKYHEDQLEYVNRQIESEKKYKKRNDDLYDNYFSVIESVIDDLDKLKIYKIKKEKFTLQNSYHDREYIPAKKFIIEISSLNKVTVIPEVDCYISYDPGGAFESASNPNYGVKIFKDEARLGKFIPLCYNLLYFGDKDLPKYKEIIEKGISDFLIKEYRVNNNLPKSYSFKDLK